MQRFARLIASGFGSGFAPAAPGTAGSLVALAIGAGLLWVGPYGLPVATALALGAGLWAIGAAGGSDDPGWVVIDEFVGQFLAMLALARPSPAGLALAFGLFRLLDVTKPGPIGWADRRHGALGVMGDDVIAGGLAGLVVWAMHATWPGIV